MFQGSRPLVKTPKPCTALSGIFPSFKERGQNCALWMTLRKDGFRPDGHIEIKGNHPENSGCQDVDGMNVNLEIVKQGLAEVYRGGV